MAFSGNNQTLYNAALNGCLAGCMSGRIGTDPTTGDYASAGAAASAFAKEVDSLIATDATLSGAGPATVVPATAANQQNALAKQGMMNAISKAYWEGRVPTDATAADYATAAAACVAVYNEAIAQYALAPGGTSLS